MQASDIMTTTLLTVTSDDSIMKALRLMLQNRISGLPVVDPTGALIGILTEGDLIRRAETGTQVQRPTWLEVVRGGRAAADYVHVAGRKVGEIMHFPVYTVSEDASLKDIVELMEKHHVKRVPVQRDGKLVGIVSRANLLRALASVVIDETKTAAHDDASIKRHLVDELNKQPWAPNALTNIIVSNGVVHFWGVITDERQRQGMHVAAENTPGVRGIKDHMVWVEPMSGWAVPGPDDEAAAAAQA